MALAVGLLAVWFAGAAGCTASKSECRSDGECEGERVCVQGGGVLVSGGTCIARDWLDASAPGDTRPSPEAGSDAGDGTDGRDADAGVDCTTDSDCGSGEICNVEVNRCQRRRSKFIVLENADGGRLLPYCGESRPSGCTGQRPTAPGADLMGVELTDSAGNTIAWGEAVGAQSDADTYTDFQGVLDGRAPDRDPEGESLCPVEMSASTVATLGCSGWVAVGFPNGDRYRRLRSSQTIRVHEHGSQCTDDCPSDETACTGEMDAACAEQHVEVTICTVEAGADDFEEEGRMRAVCSGEPAFSGYNVIVGSPSPPEAN